MKRLALFFSIVSISTFSLAQAPTEYDYGSGEDSVQCLENLSVYQNRYRNESKNGDFSTETINAWRDAFWGCPQSSKNIYSPHGINIFESLAKKAKTKEAKKAYVDTVELIYDRRIEYFGDKYKYLGYKGADMFLLDKHRYEKAYKLCKLSVDSLGVEANIKPMVVLMQTALIKVGRKTMTKPEAIELYQQIDEIFKYNSEKGSQAHIAWREKLEKLFLRLDPDCDDITGVYKPKFEKNPEDIDLLKRITKSLSKDCADTELYLKASVNLDKLEPSASSKKNIAEMYVDKNNTSQAIEYYEQSIELEEDAEKKAESYYRMANLYISSPQKSVKYAEKALDLDSNMGEAYLLIASQYVSGIEECAEDAEYPELEKWKALWAAEDLCKKAKSVDPSISSKANDKIAKYRGNFPDVETMFGYNITEGSEQTISSCWFTVTTTAKTK
ncbi:MAG: hypothetical protein R6U95_01495 [Bacteroidales bacterium]